MLKIQVNGIQYENVDRIIYSSRFDELASTFEITAYSSEPSGYPFKRNDEVVIFADDVKVMTGYIDRIRVQYNSRSHSITFSGPSNTADIVDSTLETLTFKTPTNLETLVEEVIDQIGSSLTVENNVSDLTEITEPVSIMDGEGAFEFLDKYARKSQVYLTDTPEGNVSIVRNENSAVSVKLNNIIGSPDINNIKSASFLLDDIDRYNFYKVKSQKSFISLNLGDDDPIADVVDQKGTQTDSAVREGRQLIISGDNVGDDAYAEERVIWEANIRKARSQIFEVTVEGHSFNDEVYNTNTLVQVIDDFADISEIMFIEGIYMTFDLGGGSETRLTLVSPRSYEIVEPQEQNTSSGILGLEFGGDASD